MAETKGLLSGGSSAMALSILIHGGLFLLIGGTIIFKVVTKPDAKFVPAQQIERPKMDLKKPRVKVKKADSPKIARRISATQSIAVPNLVLPEMASIGQGVGANFSGYEIVPDVSEMGIFGSKISIDIGNDFVGTFYSMAYDRAGEKSKISTQEYAKIIHDFVDAGWNPRVFAPFFRSPQKLYTTHIFVPVVSSEFGPSYFGMEPSPDFDPITWCVHYKGKIMRPEGGRFRFNGIGDDILLVRVDGKLVFNGSGDTWRKLVAPHTRHKDDNRYFMGLSESLVGEWFELEPSKPVDMEVLIGEVPGGHFCAYLVVEEDGVDYEKNRQGMKVLPVFKTGNISERVKEQIQYTLIQGEVDLESSLMFNLY